MTDDTPSPTTRMPVPDPAAESPTQGWPGATAPGPRQPRTSSRGGSARAIRRPRRTNPCRRPTGRPIATKPRRDGRDHGRTASILFGLVVLALGLWFFVDRTLGTTCRTSAGASSGRPSSSASALWVVLGSMRRGSR